VPDATSVPTVPPPPALQQRVDDDDKSLVDALFDCRNGESALAKAGASALIDRNRSVIIPIR
jgi:hypothetical protein